MTSTVYANGRVFTADEPAWAEAIVADGGRFAFVGSDAEAAAVAGPDAAVVDLGDGRRVDVRAETLEGDDLERAWERIAVEAPEYVKYRTKTDRAMPVVRLRREPAPPTG